eukprot:scaffold648394_cov46-Prasinocladus_malaysianus.AAC.1
MVCKRWRSMPTARAAICARSSRSESSEAPLAWLGAAASGWTSDILIPTAKDTVASNAQRSAHAYND